MDFGEIEIGSKGGGRLADGEHRQGFRGCESCVAAQASQRVAAGGDDRLHAPQRQFGQLGIVDLDQRKQDRFMAQLDEAFRQAAAVLLRTGDQESHHATA
jgi:hypothetical protein